MPEMVLTLGGELREQAATSRKGEDGQTVVLPARWVVSMFFMSFDHDRVQLWAASAGEAAYSFVQEDLEGALERALNRFPVDGRDLIVEDGRVQGIDDSFTTPLRPWALRAPSSAEREMFSSTVTGCGIAIDQNPDDGTIYMAPFISFPIHRASLPTTVHARLLRPLSPETRAQSSDGPFGRSLEELFNATFSARGRPGGVLMVRPHPRSWYEAEQVYPPTVMGKAFARAAG